MDKKQPNILFVTSDQHRGDCLGVAGHPCIRTPHLDALSYAGIRFANAYTNAPVCIPARTTIITGRDAHTNGCPGYNEGHVINREKGKFLGSLLTGAGYQTQIIGKTHWHTEPTFRAGFESILTQKRLEILRENVMGRSTKLTGMGGNELSPTLSQFPPELNSTQWTIDRSLEFIEDRDRTCPFFLWVSLTEPHPPNVIHEPYYSMYDNEDIPEPVMPDWAADDQLPRNLYMHKWSYNPGPMKAGELRKARGVYYGMITHIDHQLGRLFGKIMREGLWDNTLVVYTTDHGEKLGDFGDFCKSAFTENSAQIPFIVKQPAWVKSEPGRVSDALVELADLLPTFCDYAGASIPEDLTGRSLRGVLEETGGKVRDELHGQLGTAHMYHDGTYKYLYFTDDGKELLFNVREDREDRFDLSGDPQLLTSMREKFIQHLTDEGHSDVADGRLVNQQLPKPTQSQLRKKKINTVKGSI